MIKVWLDGAKLRLLHNPKTLCQGITNFFGKLVLVMNCLRVFITNFLGRIANEKSPFVARIPVDSLVFRVVSGVRNDVVVVERDFSFGLLARVFLLFVDVFQTDFPQVEVANKESDVDE